MSLQIGGQAIDRAVTKMPPFQNSNNNSSQPPPPPPPPPEPQQEHIVQGLRNPPPIPDERFLALEMFEDGGDLRNVFGQRRGAQIEIELRIFARHHGIEWPRNGNN
ncbi:hypothetical protein GPALN_003005 [Globodera pallida]|nr:hypothetical protein GPALN_003005 [Globodera pallida]